MSKSKIEYCDRTVNPYIGCANNPQCDYCYARNINNRFHYVKDFSKPEYFPHKLKEIFIKKPQIIFIGSMCDLFGDGIKLADTIEIFKACKDNPQHTYIFLTKNPETYSHLINIRQLPTENNFWFGSTVDNMTRDVFINPDRDKKILKFNTYICAEPIQEDISNHHKLNFVDGVIVGQETGNRKGKPIVRRYWLENLYNKCDIFKIPVYTKNSLNSLFAQSSIDIINEKYRNNFFKEGHIKNDNR